MHQVIWTTHVYFLNTQKISRNGKLTQHSDYWQYTIWEILDTVALPEKGLDR